MKYIKSVLYYLSSIIVFVLFLFAISSGSISNTFELYSRFYIYFNIFFASLYFYINNDKNIKNLLILSLLSLFITLIILEVIYPKSLIHNLQLDKSEFKINKKVNLSANYDEDLKEPLENIDKAEYYFNKGEFITAWIYADGVLTSDKSNSYAKDILEKVEKSLKNPDSHNYNSKYIEILRYKNLINQNRYLDAYYYCLKRINDMDFFIKLNSCYNILLNDYYSIDNMISVINMSGYSDIKFYYTKGRIILYSIEKLVEYNSEYYIKNLKIDNLIYPYIFIDSKGVIISKGFKEDKRFVNDYNKPDIPLSPSNLKFFSEEFFNLSKSSLYLNIKIFSLKNIKYFNDRLLTNLLITRLSGYLSIIILFFMVHFFMRDRNYINYLFCYSFVLISLKWIIKKIGLIFIYSGLSLSIIVVLLLFTLWFIVIMKLFNFSPSLSSLQEP